MSQPCIKTLWAWDTDYSADSVEWCPIVEFNHIFVCGTYQLTKQDEEVQSTNAVRLGKIYLFSFDPEVLNPSLLQTINTAAILDQKWCHHTINGYPTLATVTADGSLQIYKLTGSQDSMKLELLMEGFLKIEQTLALSVDWSTNKVQTCQPQLIVSDSKGRAILFCIDEGLKEQASWKAHDFEAWIAAFNSWSPHTFYTGGDDCLFKAFDTRIVDAVLTNRRHSAGVTTLTSNIYEEHVLYSGSYDENIRVWDVRNLKSELRMKDIGGGIWRLRINPKQPKLLLAACMYGGFKILSIKDDCVDILEEYNEHTSIAYGVDWQYYTKQTDYFATCSFYDCKLHVCEFNMNK